MKAPFRQFAERISLAVGRPWAFIVAICFIIVWAIIYGLLKLVRGTRAVQMAVGLLGVGLLYQLSVILGLETLQFVMRNTLLYFGFAILAGEAPGATEYVGGDCGTAWRVRRDGKPGGGERQPGV